MGKCFNMSGNKQCKMWMSKPIPQHNIWKTKFYNRMDCSSSNKQ